jgi:hypothetical protein
MQLQFRSWLLDTAVHPSRNSSNTSDESLGRQLQVACNMGKKQKRINHFVKLQQQKFMVMRQLRQLVGQNQALRQREQVQWPSRLTFLQLTLTAGVVRLGSWGLHCD